MANFLEAYAETLELNVWTSSTIQTATWDDTAKNWSVAISKGGDESRTLIVKHLIFATGFGGGVANMPLIPHEVTAE